MINLLKVFQKKPVTNVTSNDMRNLQPDKIFFKGIFLKQNLLGFFSCLSILLFGNILKTIMFFKTFDLGHQLWFILFFVLSMAFLSLMLFQLNYKILR